jgi:hypothetical protein
MSRPSLAWRGGHLAVLWAFAFLQPLFDLLGDTPEFFVARGNGRGDILVLAFGLALVPPALMLGLEWLADRVRSGAGWWLHLIFVAGLVGAFALQLAKDIADGPAAILLLAASATGVLGAYAYARTTSVPTALRYLSPAPLIFIVILLLGSPVSKLVLPQDEVAASEVDSATDAPVVVIFFDELPASSLMDEPGRIDARRYPAFAELAASSTWFPYATTVADGTTDAVPALLTGELPARDSVPNAVDHPDNLFTLLGGSYRLNVTEDATELCPTRLCGGRDLESFPERIGSLTKDLSIVSGHLVLPDSLRDRLPAVDQSFEDFGGGDGGEGAAGGQEGGVGHGIDTRSTALDPFLEQVDAQPRSLHFLHLLVPHFPWELLPSGQRYPTDLEAFSDGFMDPEGRWYDKRWLVEHGLQRHLLQVGYTDWALGQVIDRLKQAGIWDEALVVVAADHGGAFVPGDYRRQVTDANYAELASVPILVKSPGQSEPEVDERALRTDDVLPTIADELGIELPFEVEGEPASKLGARDEIELSHGGEDPVTVPFARYRRDLGRIVARNRRLFGSEPGWAGLYLAGPEAGLVGRRLADLEVSGTGEGVRLVDASHFDDVDRDAGEIPALVKGTIDSGAELGDPLAIAVNGRVVATGEAYEAFEATRVIAAIPPQSLRPGANEVEVLVVEGSGRQPRLRSLGGT